MTITVTSSKGSAAATISDERLKNVASNKGDAYVWGGGHGRLVESGFDCSGGVRKWLRDTTGKDVGSIVARDLYNGSVARQNGHQQIPAELGSINQTSMGYWAYTKGSASPSGAHCGFYFHDDKGQLVIIHASGRKSGVKMLVGAEAEKYVEYVRNRDGRFFTARPGSVLHQIAAKAELYSGGYGDVPTMTTAAVFIDYLRYQEEQEKKKKEESNKQEKAAKQRLEAKGIR